MLYTNRYTVIDKIINRVLSKKNYVWSKISPDKAVGLLYKDEKLSVTEFSQRLRTVTGDFDKELAINIPSAEHNSILEYADRALNHEFNILGSGWVKLQPLNWTEDFIHGFSWANRGFYRSYKLVSGQGDRDIKVVWELNRCHHLLWMGEAYLLTGDGKYATEIVGQISDWIAQNPLMYSVNWTCSMDVAIRAVNWIYALSMISGSGAIDEVFVRKVMRSLFDHLFFIINNLEKTIPNSGNHYLSDLSGILFIAPLYPTNRFAKRCSRFALKEFNREALIELNDDGSNYENSISYHRLVTELFLYTLLSLKRRNQSVPEEVASRISRATDYIRFYSKFNGLAPVMGDNDNGRLLPFVPRDFRTHSYLADIGSRIFYGDDIIPGGEYAFMGSVPTISVRRHTPIQASLSGIAVAEQPPAFLIVTNGGFGLDRCRKQGQQGGTHTHPDNLSFELALGNYDFLIDPGTYVYTSDFKKRNLLRSTGAHNTVVVDGQNLAEFSNSSAFVMKQLLTDIEIKTTRVSETTTKISGQFDFNNGNLHYRHKREFTLNEHDLRITDRIISEGQHQVRLNFIVPPAIEVKCEGSGVRLLSDDFELALKAGCSASELKCATEAFPCSPSYGIINEGTRVAFSGDIFNEGLFETSIQWTRRK